MRIRSQMWPLGRQTERPKSRSYSQIAWIDYRVNYTFADAVVSCLETDGKVSNLN